MDIPEEYKELVDIYIKFLKSNKAVSLIGIEITEGLNDSYTVESNFQFNHCINTLDDNDEAYNVILLSMLTTMIVECFDRCQPHDVINRMTEVLNSYIRKEGITPPNNIMH